MNSALFQKRAAKVLNFFNLQTFFEKFLNYFFAYLFASMNSALFQKRAAKVLNFFNLQTFFEKFLNYFFSTCFFRERVLFCKAGANVQPFSIQTSIPILFFLKNTYNADLQLYNFL